MLKFARVSKKFFPKLQPNLTKAPADMADNPAEQNINKPPATRSQRVVEKQNRLPANGNANANAVANAVLSN